MLIEDPKKDFRTFRIAAASPMGTKRGTGRGGFIDSALAAVDGFYGAVVQQIRPWSAQAPQLPRAGRTAAEEAGIDIEPPAKDLAEQADTVVASGPLAAVPPKTVSEGVRAEATAASGDVPPERAPHTCDDCDDEQDSSAEVITPGAGDVKDTSHRPPTDDLMSWDAAQERLDHERELDGTDSGNAPTA